MIGWYFGPAEDDVVYGMPSRRQQLFHDGIPVGEIEVHAHRRKGVDKVTDLSWGVTAITYGPLSPVGEPITKPRKTPSAPAPAPPEALPPAVTPA